MLEKPVSEWGEAEEIGALSGVTEYRLLRIMKAILPEHARDLISRMLAYNTRLLELIQEERERGEVIADLYRIIDNPMVQQLRLELWDHFSPAGGEERMYAQYKARLVLSEDTGAEGFSSSINLDIDNCLVEILQMLEASEKEDK